MRINLSYPSISGDSKRAGTYQSYLAPQGVMDNLEINNG